MKILCLCLCVGVLCLSGVVKAGPTYSFVNISNNNAVDAAIGEAQLSVELFDLGDTAQFVFSNSGLYASSITDIYFDDGTNSIFNAPIFLADIDNSDAGVSFAPGATPGNVPAANLALPGFDTTDGLSADSDSPHLSANGVNPGETLGITLAFIDGVNFNDLINEMASGDLRIALHVQGFDGGGSETFVNTPIVPIPSSLLLATIGIGTVKFLRQRKGKRLA